jgi:hypothetical protein
MESKSLLLNVPIPKDNDWEPVSVPVTSPAKSETLAARASRQNLPYIIVLLAFACGWISDKTINVQLLIGKIQAQLELHPVVVLFVFLFGWYTRGLSST